MDVDAYLRRIGCERPRSPSMDGLRELHVAHMLAVPFENLDVIAGRPIVLDEARLFAKIVEGGRGGFCYELNGLFAGLLRALGYHVSLLSARVAREDGEFSPEFDHLALMVELDQRWLVDVGFGDSFVEPLTVAEDAAPQAVAGGTHRIRLLEGERIELERLDGERWLPRYRCSLRPRRLSDFAEMCRYHQTSPLSPFTSGRVCSIALPDGRLTLRERRLIERHGQERLECELEGPAEVATVLRERFGVAEPGDLAY